MKKPIIATFLLLCSLVTQSSLALTIFNNYKDDIVIELFSNPDLYYNDTPAKRSLLKIPVKSGSTVQLFAPIKPDDVIYAEIYCKKWITHKPISGPMFFMRAPANPKGIRIFDLSAYYDGNQRIHRPYTLTNDHGLIIQQQKFFSTELTPISPQQLQDPTFKNQIDTVMHQKYSWLDHLKGNERKALTISSKLFPHLLKDNLIYVQE